MISLNYRDSRPIYEQIKEGFRNLLVTEAIAAGERLPSVRELAAELAINPNTIQRAYRELEAEGYIYSVPGKGSFAADRKNIVEIRQRELLQIFDDTAAKLKELGMTAQALKTRIDKEGERK